MKGAWSLKPWLAHCLTLQSPSSGHLIMGIILLEPLLAKYFVSSSSEHSYGYNTMFTVHSASQTPVCRAVDIIEQPLKHFYHFIVTMSLNFCSFETPSI